jgi:hypothetical protein
MKRALELSCALLLCGPLRAQQPAPNPGVPQASNADMQYSAAQIAAAPQQAVPIQDEPHHRLVLQNDFVRVYNVVVQPLDATLLHRHDLPYLYVSMGPADIVNAVQGKPEVHMVLQDGETHYSPGGFAHIARTDSGLLFHNITIELPKPQGTTRNICKEVISGRLGDCPQPAGGQKNSPANADDQIPYFETDELRVDLVKVGSGRDYADEKPKLNSLLVALNDANLDASLGGDHLSFLHGGDILWMPAGLQRRVVDFLGTKSNFLLVSFKDSANSAKP